MTDVKIYELKHDGERYRANGWVELLEWAINFHISLEDEYRQAGDDEWIPVADNVELTKILDPANWWTVTQKNGEFIAHDWETVLKWTRQGRLTKDVKIEGPQTPPGGMLGIASPELAPFLKDPVPDEPIVIPPKLRIDGREYLPGSMDALVEWIKNSRIPLETEISIDDGEWEPILECGEFEESLWPTEAVEARDAAEEEALFEEAAAEEETDEEETDEEETDEEETDEEETDEEETDEEETDEEETDEEDVLISTFASEDVGPAEPYIVITSTDEEYSLDTPQEVLALFKKKEIRSFDEVRHPDLPEGSMYVSDFVEIMDIRSGISPGYFVGGIMCVVVAVLLFIFRDTSRYLMITGGVLSGIAALIFLFKSFLSD